MATKLEIIQNKIFSSIEDPAYMRLVNGWKIHSDVIVFTNGCFDILHRGHVEYLAQAAQLGHRLVVGLNSDSSVKRLKGDSRPINDWYARAEVLASLQWVDAVVGFDEDTPKNLIENTVPDLLVKGGDYKAEDVVGYDFVKANGGDTVIINFVDGYSTTNIIEKM
ncbi:MAG: D-glycero-beta-D-manno-heptose 1-phosphate adenylyltransferase [Bacteroidales bacterium]|nr:D-glycero-beta-D-manno-heptose 1-phosphate adenylyltransferase [Bacteroidales bacterium]